MRILLITNSDLGLYKFRKEIVEALCESNEVLFCVPEGEYVEELRLLGAEYRSCDFLDRRGMNPLHEAHLFRFYRTLIVRERPDLVMTFTIKPNIYAGLVCSKLGIPFLPTITGLGTALEEDSAFQAVLLALYKRALRGAQTVFFQNAHNRRFMVSRGVLSGASDIIPGSGVSLRTFIPQPYPSSGSVVFLFVARIMEQKGIEEFLAAAKMIHEENSDVQFHVCGPIESGYKGKLLESQDVIYHGSVRDTVEMYRAASCVVLPTYYPEGLSNVLLESCASARPIIATSRPGCAEVLQDGVNGFSVRERDSLDLADRMRMFMSMPIEERRKMGLNGRRIVEERFDRNIVVKRYVAEVQRLAGGGAWGRGERVYND